MMRRPINRLPSRLALATLTLLLAPRAAPQPAAPTPPTGPPLELSWSDIAAAIDRHPLLGAARSALAAAEGDLAAARSYPNPDLAVSVGTAAGLEDAAGDERRRVWGIEISLPLLSPFAYRSGVGAATAERDAVARDAATQRLAVRAQLRAHFWEVAHGQERLRTLEHSREQVSRLVEVARLRVAHGEARPLEAAQFEIELAELEIEQRAFEEEQAARRRALVLWLGGRLPEVFRVTADLAALPAVPDLATATARASALHPELQAAALRLQAAAHHARFEARSRWPEIAIGGFREQELDAESYGATAEVSLPLWNWNGGAVARARAEEQQARFLLEWRTKELAAEVAAAHAEAVSAGLRAQRYQEEIRPQAAATAAAFERMYQLGEAGVLEVLDARRALLEIDSALAQARLSAQLAALRLDTLMGGSDDD